MDFVKFFARRLGRLLLTVFIISTLVFFVVRVIPGDPALIIAGMDASPEDVQAIRVKLGTDKPLLSQYLVWLSSIARFDFGTTLISGEPVIKLIMERFPLTLTLALLGISIGIFVAVPLGVMSAVKRWSLWDYFGLVFSQLGMAIPSFWLGMLLLILFAVKIRILPLFGADTPAHFILPAVSLGFARAAIILRMARASMIEELSKEYIITARAKGLTERMVKYKHALKNGLLPVITVTGIQFGYMLGGAIIVEQVFSMPGLGRLFLFGIYQRDFTLIQGGVIFVAIIFSLVNFLADILYSIVNPKIRVE
ncbi:MAG TPA: peptide ABC transporter [Spirochaetaceae bacterium]|jgi:peptide/nickel transport system permease protein|nr:peptide ABC transporter [Spirochaetaceae bacterium]HOI22368.1 ABC transporter permease [Spirochaetales bacterium]